MNDTITMLTAAFNYLPWVVMIGTGVIIFLLVIIAFCAVKLKKPFYVLWVFMSGISFLYQGVITTKYLFKIQKEIANFKVMLEENLKEKLKLDNIPKLDSELNLDTLPKLDLNPEIGNS